MKNIPEFYILGRPIETDIGEINFIKVGEYPDYFSDLQMISMSKDEIIYKYSSINKNNELDDFINELKKYELFDIVTQLPEFVEPYTNIFIKVFNNEDILPLINKDNFNDIRTTILLMNCQKEDKINPNPEIQKALERSRRVKNQENGNIAFSDIVTSIVGFNGLTYDNINNMTIYQLYMTYYRIAQIKGYDTSTLFATVSTEKINIESWSKHIDLFEEEKHVISHEQFKKTTGKVLSE
ncbi:hypothetical protein CHH83_02665 [Bacillus sp. 7586-K]|nr:hypothetical protein CHH83_02665 [Bacillus sp. 7586-K]